jgi:hypothetical protein
METPAYIRALLTPNGKKPAGKRIWSIDLESTWLPFFVATNAEGQTHIAPEAIGAPIRLVYAGDGSVKFGKSGRPATKVAKELGEAVRLVRENFAASLQAYAGKVITDNADGYKAQVALAQEAGAPIMANDKAKLDEAISKAIEQALAEAEAKKPAVAVATKPAEAIAEADKAEAVAEAVAVAEGKPKRKAKEPVLVTA